MKTNRVITLSAVALGIWLTASAQAGWSVGITLGAPVCHPAPPPACPPPVVYYPPRPACPPVVYLPPGHNRHGYWYDRYRHYEYRQPRPEHRDDWRYYGRGGCR